MRMSRLDAWQEVLRCVKIANEQNQDWGLLYTDEGTRNESGKVLHRHKLFRRPDIPFDMDAMYLDRILLDKSLLISQQTQIFMLGY